MSEKEYDLTLSKKALGPLYPILVDVHDHIIDGFHRENADPKWPRLKLENVHTPVQLELARLAAHGCRRSVPETEIQQRIGFLIGAGLKASEIAEKTGLSERTVYNHMPQDLKDKQKVEAGRAGGSAASLQQTVTTSDKPLAKPIITERQDIISNIIIADCGHRTHITKAHDLNGRTLCQLCYEQQVKIPKAELKSPPSALDKWEHRAAHMKVLHSKMETNLYQRVLAAGYPVERDKWYCTEGTSPDIDAGDVVFYVDGKDVHTDPDKDDLLRSKLASMYKKRVVPLPYEAWSQAKEDELFRRIVNELSFGGPKKP